VGISYGVDPTWAYSTVQGRNHISTLGVIQTGLVYNIDLGSTLSYPGTGVVLNDLKQNHNLTLVNGPTYSSNDRYGALIFDGVNDYCSVTLPLGSPLSLTQNFTIEQVFKPTAYQTSNYYGLTNMLLSKGTASTYNYATQVTNDTTISFIKRNNAEGLQGHSFTVPSLLNNPNMVTLVIQNGDNTAIDTVSCYYNGQFVSTQNIIGGLMAAYANDPLYLCGLGGLQYTVFTGSYYSGRIYNRALTANEIQKNFNAIRRRYDL
jgi:hypothetical protein